MECGKLTAKLRDAVPVCFMVDGKEVKRYKNILRAGRIARGLAGKTPAKEQSSESGGSGNPSECD